MGGLCEPGEVAAEGALRDMGFDEFADDPAVVVAFAQLRALAVPGALRLPRGVRPRSAGR